jgi:L-serine dehydratase
LWLDLPARAVQHLLKTIMQRISVFDMLKIGVGPSSSHTMGPWRAAQRFLDELAVEAQSGVSRIRVELYGSLAKTGRGHGTDVAVQLGLCGECPETIDTTTIPERIREIAAAKRIRLCGSHDIPFDPKTDIAFLDDQQLPLHPNALRFKAQLEDGTEHDAVFYSIGGGFIVKELDRSEASAVELPYPIETAHDLLVHCRSTSWRISDVVMQNELCWRNESQIHEELRAIRDTMIDSIRRGCHTEGVLPGGLQVRRRAAGMVRRLLGTEAPGDFAEWTQAIKAQSHDFRRVLDWVSCFALAVNEENAAFGRIVTAPTNGSAGVIPAVMSYCEYFCDVPEDAYAHFLLTAGEIGCIFKQGATISAALGGCQAEIGVAAAMAAAALAECLGGSPAQAVEAAEIAMEHHLGLTCDPVGGLVQIPCIERNAMGAVKAITAAEMALQRDPSEARVSLDVVIRTMWETAQDMNAKYKETSEGGLAVQIAVNVSEC